MAGRRKVQAKALFLALLIIYEQSHELYRLENFPLRIFPFPQPTSFHAVLFPLFSDFMFCMNYSNGHLTALV
jgi:hypothetical protein